MKKCMKCGSLDRYPTGGDGKPGPCRPCTVLTGRKRRGIKNATTEMGEGKSCAICEVMLTPGRGLTGACMDHDARTGLVRGWLCFRCNRALGGFQDSPHLLQRASDYITSPKWGMT